MNSLNPPNPPTVDPSAIQLAMNLLGALGDIKGAKARLLQLSDAQDSYLKAKSEHDASAASSAAAAANLGDLTGLAGRLADKQAELDQRATQLDVAASAHAARQKNMDERERAIDAQAADLQRRTAAFDARVKTFRDQLAS